MRKNLERRMSKNLRKNKIAIELLEIRLELRNGRIRNVNQPPASSVTIYDYDTDKYHKDCLENDPYGKLCCASVWIKYPYDKLRQQVKIIDYEIIIAVKKCKVTAIKCPKTIKIVVNEVNT
jgi:hypothetical protein